ncbi:metal-dependent hydrolase [Desulfovibrio sp. OttesenSCG-928-F07]|nr:metal-dependent hydrolase [Desulfovibrio sp. OttesenSCG-928-F07]
MTKITWHGHANFNIECEGLNILIDPFFTGNPKADCNWEDIKKVDLVLLTHMHGDHTGDCVALCKKHGAMLGAVVGIPEQLISFGLPAELVLNTIGFNIGGTVQFKGISITMTEATHTSEAGLPTGFILQMQDQTTVYHAGDTGIFSNMQTWGELYNINVALLPAGGLFTMDTRQAALAAKFLQADKVIPMHWGTFPALKQDMNDFAQMLALQSPKSEAVILQPGETFNYCI